MRKTIHLLLITLILLVAMGVRFHLLGAQSLWHDEGNAYVQATRGFNAIAENAARDIHPPGYYWLLALWRGMMGETEFGLRSLSAFASLLSVAFAYALGGRLFGRVAALSAAAFVALNTFSIFYAQEARMYALLALWAAAAMWAFVGFIGRSTWRGLDESSPYTYALALALLNAAGLWTHYAFPFVMLVQGVMFLAWLIYGPVHQALRTTGVYIALNLLTIVLFLPWLPTALDQITNWPSTGQPIELSQALATLLGYFSFGITVIGGTTATIAFFLLFGLLQPRSQPAEWWRVALPVVWVVVSVGLFLGFGLYREANLKFLLPTQIAFALWVGHGVAVLWRLQTRRWQYVPKLAAVFGTLVVLVNLAAGLNPLYHDPAYQRDDYRTIAALIEATAGPDDAVILNAPNQQEVFDYYYEGETPVYPLPRGLGGDDDATLTATRAVIDAHERIFTVLWGTDERDPNNVVENTLDSEAFEASSAWYGDVRLVRYAAPAEFDQMTPSTAQFGEHITLERYGLSATTIQPCDVLQVRLEWSTDAPLEQRYGVFVQLLDENGALAAQRAAEPGGGQQPTTSWQPGETVVDNHALIVPNDLSPANYALIIGFYNPANPQERLPINDGDYLLLAPITLTREEDSCASSSQVEPA